MTCQMCRERVKPWVGDDPLCYFEDVKENWMCATVNAIRELCYEGQPELPRGVHYDYCNDAKFATFNIEEVKTEEGNYIGRCLYVAWYKTRGYTEALWVLNALETPRPPTEEELLAIIRHFTPRGGRRPSSPTGKSPDPS